MRARRRLCALCARGVGRTHAELAATPLMNAMPHGLTLALLALLSASVAAGPITHVVPHWTDGAGYCKKLPGLDEAVHRPRGLDPLHVVVGDKVSFTYSTNHNLWKHPSLDALESCDYSEAVMLANSTRGGGCEDETDLACMAAATPFEMDVEDDGTWFLSCNVGNHCRNGQRLVIHKSATRLPAPREVVVPLWTDNAGYCQPIPGVFPEEQHGGTGGLRPHGADRDGGGLEPITIALGQTLVFKYSTHHDVWSHPTAASLTGCEREGSGAPTMLAGIYDGGNCTDDADLECIDASVGYKLTPTPEQVGTKLYFSCSVGDHCDNGQTLVVSVTTAITLASNGLEEETWPIPLLPFLAGVVLGGVMAGMGGCFCWGAGLFSSRKGGSRSTPPEVVMSRPRPGGSDDLVHAEPTGVGV